VWRTISLVVEGNPTASLLLTRDRQVRGYRLLELAGLAVRNDKRGVTLTEAGRTWIGMAGGHENASARFLWMIVAARLQGTDPDVAMAQTWARAALIDTQAGFAPISGRGGIL
jgi:hypothetical protein